MSKVLQHALFDGGVLGEFRDNTLNTIPGPRHPHFRRVPEPMSAGTPKEPLPIHELHF